MTENDFYVALQGLMENYQEQTNCSFDKLEELVINSLDEYLEENNAEEWE